MMNEGAMDVFPMLSNNSHLIRYPDAARFTLRARGPMRKFNKKWGHHTARHAMAEKSVRAHYQNPLYSPFLIAFFYCRNYSTEDMRHLSTALGHHLTTHIQYARTPDFNPKIRDSDPERHGIVAVGHRISSFLS